MCRWLMNALEANTISCKKFKTIISDRRMGTWSYAMRKIVRMSATNDSKVLYFGRQITVLHCFNEEQWLRVSVLIWKVYMDHLSISEFEALIIII